MRKSGDGGGITRWRCKCDCGNEILTQANTLRVGKSQSCGCLRSEMIAEKNKTHGMTEHRFYNLWKKIHQRCRDKRNQYYGGRGIKVSEEWNHFEPFAKWIEEYENKNGIIPKGFEIDRENVDGDYTPDNCRFLSHADQCRNKRNNILVEHNGERLIITDFIRKYSLVSKEVFYKRLSQGMDIKEAAFSPPKN